MVFLAGGFVFTRCCRYTEVAGLIHVFLSTSDSSYDIFSPRSIDRLDGPGGGFRKLV